VKPGSGNLGAGRAPGRGMGDYVASATIEARSRRPRDGARSRAARRVAPSPDEPSGAGLEDHVERRIRCLADLTESTLADDRRQAGEAGLPAQGETDVLVE